MLRRARLALAPVTLAALAMGLYGFSNAVDVIIDGESYGLRTYAGTVAAVLETINVEVGPGDEVSPPLDSQVENGLTIDIDRAITVDIEVDGGVARRVTAPADSVANVLALADMDDLRDRGALVQPGWNRPVSDGDVVRVSLPVTVTIEVDGDEVEVDTFADDVDAVLDQEGVEVGPDDIVKPLEGSLLFGPTTIIVKRVDVSQEVEEITLDHDEERRETKDLRRGTTRVAQEGRDGLRHDVYEVTLVDGDEVERELVDREVVRKPKPRVVLVGTHVPPPPPPPAPAPKQAASSSTGTSIWDALARCESGGNWSYRGTYHGGLQFHPSTWSAHKPSGYPTYAYEATREQQIEVGKRVQRSQGWGAWPHCSRVVGLR